MSVYHNSLLYRIISPYEPKVIDIIFFLGVLSTVLTQFIYQDLFLFDVIGLLSYSILVVIPLYLLTDVLFPNYNLELRIAAVISLFVLYMIAIGLALIALSYIIGGGLFSESPAISMFILSSTIIYIYYRDKTSTRYTPKTIPKRLSKILVTGFLLIFISVIFSWHFRFNQPFVQTAILYSFVILLAIVGSSNQINKIETTVVIFVISLALVFHNELALPILGAGDSEKEYYVSNIVLAQANWPVDIPQSKFSVITIVVLHPILTLLTPLSLEGMYRLVYPMLFSAMPPILYLVYQGHFDRKVSYWGTLLIVFLHPFYTVYALNTRTGYVLLFISLLLLFYFHAKTVSLAQRGLRLGLLFLLSTTYYATGPMFIVVLGVAKVAQVADSYLRNTPTNPAYKIPTIDIILLGIGTAAWLIYTTNSYTFDLVAGVLTGTIIRAAESLFDFSSSAGGSAFNQEFSYTFQLISYSYIVLTMLILLSLALLTYLRYVRPADQRHSGAYYPVFVGGGLIFIAAFLPTSSIGIARLYTIGLIFLAPASFFAIYYVSRQSGMKMSVIIPALMIFILLINTGTVGMALGDDRITQQHLIEDNSGSVHDYHGSGWAINFKESGGTIYGSGDGDRLQGEFFVTEYESGVPGGYSPLRSADQTGLIYLSARSVSDQTIIPKLWYGGGLATEREFISYDQLGIEETNLVYSTGQSQVRYRG